LSQNRARSFSTKEDPRILLRASALEGHARGLGIRNVTLINERGKKTRLAKAEEGDFPPDESQWVLPNSEIDKAADLVGEMHCEVYFKQQIISVPIKAHGVAEFMQFGGFKIQTEISKKEKGFRLEFNIEWPSGLNFQDTKELKDIFKRASDMPLADAELQTILDWVAAH
jgi:hypothetical protein